MKDQLILLRPIDMLKPFFAGKRILDRIHFFDKAGVKYSTWSGWFDAVQTENGYRQWDYTLKRLNLFIKYEVKHKPNFELTHAFVLPVANKRGDSYAHGELYIPLSEYQTEIVKGIYYHQAESERQLYDAIILKQPLSPTPDSFLGVGISFQGEVLPITKEEAKRQETKKLLERLDQPLQHVVQFYVEREDYYRLTRQRLEKEREEIDKQLKTLDKERLFWIEDLVKPIGELLLKEKEFEGCTMQIYGPFGIGAETSIFFSKDDKTIIGHLSFEPGDLDVGELRLRNTRVNTHEYKDGTIAELNGMNHPLMAMPNTIRELVKVAMSPEAKQVCS